MAVIVRTTRQGLPRRPGGPAWPPLAEPLEAPEPATTGEPVAEPSDPVPGTVVVHGAPRRRSGLPRVRGGEPWPPGGDTAGASVADPRVVEPVEPVAAVAAAPVPAAPAAPDPAVALHARAPETAAPSNVPRLRRGLPRTPGGEPWPPAAAGAPASPRSRAELDRRSPPGAVMLPAPEAPASPPAAGRAVAAAPPAPSTAPPAPAATAAAAVRTPDTARPPVPALAQPGAPTPATRPIAPRPAATPPPTVRERLGGLTRRQWTGAALVSAFALFGLIAAVVLGARALAGTSPVANFLLRYPGEYHLPSSAPVGLPAWLGWQHFFNALLILLIVRSGLQVRTERKAPAMWASRRQPGRKISLTIWAHQSLDVLWLLNGLVFGVLLLTTGQWMRIVPTSWEVFPHALSALLQYLTLDWPTENGWVNYNGLQQLAYFVTVFVAAPLAAVTGVRMSSVWPTRWTGLSRRYPVEVARALHFPTMLYFVGFIVVHVGLVLATGALRNLNHMYAAQDGSGWAGFWFFAVSVLAMGGAWVAFRPSLLAPVARLFGTVSRS